jgi:hypothetical protein
MQRGAENERFNLFGCNLRYICYDGGSFSCSSSCVTTVYTLGTLLAVEHSLQSLFGESDSC